VLLHITLSDLRRLIYYCFTSSKQYFSYIQNENKFNDISLPLKKYGDETFSLL